MTTTDQIRAACERAIQLGEAATAGKWRQAYRSYAVETQESRTVCEMFTMTSEERDSDAAFIAHARTFAPSAARAILGLLRDLEDASHGIECRSNSGVEYPCRCWKSRAIANLAESMKEVL